MSSKRSLSAYSSSDRVYALKKDSIDQIIRLISYFDIYLPDFFNEIACFHYQKAYATLEDGESLFAQWDDIKSVLQIYSSCESTYVSMVYLDPVWLRTQKLNDMHKQVLFSLLTITEDLEWCTRRVEADEEDLLDIQIPKETLLKVTYYSQLFHQFAQLVNVRLEMLQIHQEFALSSPPYNFSQHIQTLNTLLEFSKDSISHDLLQLIGDFFYGEARCLKIALMAHESISQWRFHESIVWLHKLKNSLDAWNDCILLGCDVDDDPSDVPTSCPSRARTLSTVYFTENSNIVCNSKARRASIGTLPLRISQQQALNLNEIQPKQSQNISDDQSLPPYRWLKVQKSTLGYGNALVDINQKVVSCYLTLIDSFLTKCGLDEKKVCVALIFQADSSDFDEFGYSCPSMTTKEREQQQLEGRELHYEYQQQDFKDRIDEDAVFAHLWGLRGWPSIFTRPSVIPPLEHWPNIISLLMENLNNSYSYSSPLYHYEKRSNSTYFIARVEPLISLVLIFEDKRRQGDKCIMDFIAAFVGKLQYEDVFHP